MRRARRVSSAAAGSLQIKVDQQADLHQDERSGAASRLRDAVYAEGVAVLPGALPREWAAQLDLDLGAEFIKALSVRGGTAPRGWNRFYFEPYPERLEGFLAWVTQPDLTALSELLFGPGYVVVELGCDVPLPGAVNQPWHRDFAMPDRTRHDRVLTSIAVNAAAVDVTDDMGPFQVVKGSHFEDDAGFDGGMFPPDASAAGYERRMTSMHGRMGSMSVRSGLAIHRGSASSVRSAKRQTAILGIVSPEDRAVVDRLQDPDDTSAPRLRMSQEFFDGLDAAVARHLSHEIVCDRSSELPPHHTHHDFEGLRMSALEG
jgi:hypothetical protein